MGNRKHEFGTTMESYAFLERLKEKSITASGIRVSVTGNQWAELTLHQKIQLNADTMRDAADLLRKLTSEGQIYIETTALHFERGQQFLDLINETKTEYKSTEVVQY